MSYIMKWKDISDTESPYGGKEFCIDLPAMQARLKALIDQHNNIAVELTEV